MRARRLLLIDDNPDDIMLVTRALRKQSGWQYEIDLAYTHNTCTNNASIFHSTLSPSRQLQNISLWVVEQKDTPYN